MHDHSSFNSPVSPLTPFPSERPSRRFFTTTPTASNYLPPQQFPPRTSSLQGGIQHPIPTRLISIHGQPSFHYPQDISILTPPSLCNFTPLPHNEYTVNTSTQSPPTGNPRSFYPSPPLPSSSFPLRITTTLTASLSIGLGRKKTRLRRTKKLTNQIQGSGRSTHLPPRNGSPFPNSNIPYSYYHQYNSAPAHAWGSEGEDTEEEIPRTKSSTNGSYEYSPQRLSSYELDRGVYGRVVSGEGVFIPRRSVAQGSSTAASPVSSVPPQRIYLQQHRGDRCVLELLLALFREHNTITRIARWLRKEDLFNLVVTCKQVREGILLPPTGLGFYHPGIEKICPSENLTWVTNDDDTEEDSDGKYQISPLMPVSPLKFKVGSVFISPSPDTENGVGLCERSMYLPSRPWNDSGEFIPTEHEFEDDTPSLPDPVLEAEYAERLGRLVWLLTLTVRCKSPHRQQQGKKKLKFCVWCGECVCADCDISPYIPHSHRLRRLCFDCWRLSGNERFDTEESPTLGSSTTLTSLSSSPEKAAKARNLLCSCKQGDEWICPDCDAGGRPLELDEFEESPKSPIGDGSWMTGHTHVSSKCECWVCGKRLGGGISKWNTPAQGGIGYAGSRGEDIWRLCLWCGKRMMVQDGYCSLGSL